MAADREAGLSMAEAATVLSCPVQRVAALIDDGELGFVVEPERGLIRVPIAALDDFVAHHPAGTDATPRPVAFRCATDSA